MRVGSFLFSFRFIVNEDEFLFSFPFHFLMLESCFIVLFLRWCMQTKRTTSVELNETHIFIVLVFVIEKIKRRSTNWLTNATTVASEIQGERTRNEIFEGLW